MDLQQLLIAFGLSLFIVIAARWRRWLSQSGGAAALVVGVLIMGLGGWVWGVLLGVFFVTSSILSKFKADEKRKSAEKFDKGHERDAVQVLANGGLGALLAICHAIWPSPIWLSAFVGVMATVNADTWATELGTLSKRQPRLITTGTLVEVGTSGGVTPFGTFVSLVGGGLIGLVAAFWLWSDGGMWVLIGMIAGLAGSLFDSFLGATVQLIYWDDVLQKETEKRAKYGRDLPRFRGWPFMTNDMVNLIASIVGGLVAVTITFAF
ncbi:MAG: DUF92 domain-containing protein [Candidatus Promineifilaceae bacterium]